MPRGDLVLAFQMGQRMGKRRKELGLTQERVAELAGLGYQQYNKLENGKSCMGSSTLIRVSKALQTSADYLLTGEESSQQHSEILSILNQLTNQQKDMTIQLIRLFVELNRRQ